MGKFTFLIESEKGCIKIYFIIIDDFMRKGYWFLLCVSIFSAVAQALKVDYIKKGEIDFTKILLLKVVTLFIIFFVPGIFLVRWYYKMKDRNS